MKSRGTPVIVPFFCLVMLVAAAPAPVTAQESDAAESMERIEGPEVLVTANRLETPAGEVGSSQTVITREELDRLQRTTLYDVLRSVPGLNVAQSGGPGSPASVFIRGANSGQTLVLIDGVEVNDPISTTRSFNFADLTTDNIERVEIVRGPQSTLYGSDAIGGVINVITRKGVGAPGLSLSVEGGSFNSWRERLWSGGGTDTVNYSLGLSRQDSDGISAAAVDQGNSEEDGYENSSVSVRVGFTPVENFRVNVIARYTDSTTDLDNAGGAFGDDPNHIGEQTQLVFRAEAELKLLDDLWHQKLGVSITDIDRCFLNDFDPAHPADMSESTYNGSLFKIDWQHNLHFDEHNTLTLGLETEEEKGDSSFYSESEWGPYASVFEEQSARTNGYYLQDSFNLDDHWFTTVGVRLDDHDRFGSEFTWRVTSAYLIPETGTTARGSVGTGFKAPSLFQLFSEYGNLDLDPEESLGWDVGLEQADPGGYGSVGVTWFANDFDNLLDFDPVNFLYINIAEAKTQGLEVFTAMDVGENLDLSASYTFTDTEDQTTGDDLLRRARNKFGINANYRFLAKGNLNLDLVHVGKRFDNDFSTWPASVVELDAYLLANLAGSWNFSDHWQIFGRLENLLDEEYEEVVGYGTPGFAGYLGLKFSL
jgi:vitamin B12 transporter